MYQPKLLSIIVCAAALLSACKKEQPAPTAVATPTTAPTVVPAAAPPATPAESTIIASQPGYGGSNWALNRAQVTGNILTLQFTVSPPTDKSLFDYSRFKIDQIALIDDTSAQRYSVLKDDTGRPMASPIDDKAEALRIAIAANSSGVVWLKFPAPPVTSQSVSITLPEVGPFDGIKVSR
ncbi:MULTISPECIES: hypothetical protein [Stenotrophomonas]|uniref:hypothetical protein n=1 Tax=Stenotrophomonas TaxID=40323 RepID=UPI00077000D6|nr:MULTISPECIES: hypothetical protein [Stenotrophomonas]AMJ56095.1 hypothetical protein AXG53_05140 [Stenotrophomonas sp. KCTC 12332]